MDRMKLFFRILRNISIRIIIIVSISCLVGFVLSLSLNKEYRSVLEFIGALILATGILSIFGDMGARADGAMNLTKFLVGSDNMLNEEIAITRSGYIFAIYTSLSGLILLGISILLFFYS